MKFKSLALVLLMGASTAPSVSAVGPTTSDALLDTLRRLPSAIVCLDTQHDFLHVFRLKSINGAGNGAPYRAYYSDLIYARDTDIVFNSQTGAFISTTQNPGFSHDCDGYSIDDLRDAGRTIELF